MADNSETKEKPNAPYRIIIEREFIGDKEAADVFLPVLADDIRRRITTDARTIDNNSMTA